LRAQPLVFHLKHRHVDVNPVHQRGCVMLMVVCHRLFLIRTYFPMA
jgi:hypothetical protein